MWLLSTALKIRGFLTQNIILEITESICGHNVNLVAKYLVVKQFRDCLTNTNQKNNESTYASWASIVMDNNLSHLNTGFSMKLYMK